MINDLRCSRNHRNTMIKKCAPIRRGEATGLGAERTAPAHRQQAKGRFSVRAPAGCLGAQKIKQQRAAGFAGWMPPAAA